MSNMSKEELIGEFAHLTKDELVEALEQYYEAAGFDKAKVKALKEMKKEELQEIYLMNIYEEEEDIPF